MPLNRRLLNDCKLYLILDAQVNDYDELLAIAKRAIAAGADIIQLRDKAGHAKDILRLSDRLHRLTKGKVFFIVNDRVDIALASHADGVHLGQDDVPIATARKLMGPKAIIGVSCQTLAHAQRAEQDQANYIGFGSVYKTLTKPNRNPMSLELLKSVCQRISVPVFAIGGIDLQNVKQLRIVGIDRVAVCRAICLAKDVAAEIEKFKLVLQ